MEVGIPTFHHLVYDIDESGKHTVIPGAEPIRILNVLKNWQAQLRRVIEKSIGKDELKCKVCDGIGFVYAVTQIIGKGTDIASRGKNFTKDVKYKTYTYNITFKGRTYTLTQDLPYLDLAYRYKYWGQGMAPEVVKSLVASAQKLLPVELRNQLDSTNPLRLANYKDKGSVKGETLEVLQSAKNLVQFYEKLEKVLLDAAKKNYISKKLVEEAINNIKNGWGNLKARLAIQKCPYCDGFGVNHIGHSDVYTSHAIFYDIALELLKNATTDKFDYELARHLWVERSLQTVTIETRQRNLSKTQTDKQIADKARQKFIKAYKKKFKLKSDDVYYLTPQDIFDTKREVLESTKYTYMLVRNKFREELRDEILERLKETARVSDDKRVKRHMIESLKSTVEQTKDASSKNKQYGGTPISQLTFTAQHWTTRFTGKINKKNPHYARFYSDWGGNTSRKPWSPSGVTIKQLIEQAFDKIWTKYYYKSIDKIKNFPYKREDYFRYIRVFGEDYV